MNLASFKDLFLRGGFRLTESRLSDEPIFDALGREATAQTRICGREFFLLLRADLGTRELSISLYHEILEAATVGAALAPQAVMEFNEGDFERVAQSMHELLGPASPESVNRMLALYGF